MYKKIFIIMFALVLSLGVSTKVKANSTYYNMYLNINNNQEIISMEKNNRLYMDYNFGTDTLVIRNSEEEIKTIKINADSLNSITFDSELLIGIESENERTYFDKDNFRLKYVKVEISRELIEIKYHDEVLMDAVEEFSSTFLFNSKPAISGKDAIINNIEKPYTIEQIKNLINLVAYDDYDGNLTSKITIESDNYSNNKNVVGYHKIIFAVVNSSNAKTTYELTVVNKDFNAPVITGPNEKEYSYKDDVTIEMLKELFVVTDNYDDIVDLNVDSNNFVTNTVGQYEIEFYATDEAGNKTTKKLNLSIIDDVKPIISDSNEGVIKINYREKITNGLLLLGLTANDEIDGDLTDNIKIIENNIGKELTQYIVKYEVSDNSGNIVRFERTYEVISIDIPNFFVSNSVLTIEDVNKMSIDQLAELLAEISNIEMDYYEVIVNEYEGNEDNSGVYKLSLKITDKEGLDHIVSRDINVFNKSEIKDSTKNIYPSTIIATIVMLSLLGVIIYKKRR